MGACRILVAAALAVVCTAASSRAAPLEAYGQLPTMDMVTLSPDGSKLAFVTPVKGQQMVVVEALNPPGYLTGLNGSAQKVRNLTWADSDHLLVAKSTAGLASGLMNGKEEWLMEQSLDVSKKTARALLHQDAETATSRLKEDAGMMNVVIAYPIVRTGGDHPAVLLEGYRFLDSVGLPALFSVDLATGEHKIIEKSLSEADWSWVVDNRGTPVAQYGYDEKRKYWSVRLKQAGVWTEAYGESDSIEQPEVWGVSPDGESLILRFQKDKDYVFRPLSLKDGSRGPPIEAYHDFSGVVADPATHRIIGGIRVGLNVEYVFFDKTDQDAWNQILAAFPDEEVILTSWSSDRSRIVVQVVGAIHGDTYVLVDQKTHHALGLGDAYPAIKPADISAVQSIEYRAADGRKIPAYLTLPNGRDVKNLPLVVLPHGGPQAMDEPGFDWWAQALASRGYAVLQPQFRGSYGLGEDLYQAGFGEWGRKMQTDLSDGVRALAKDGLVDAKKVCIVGGSYGGYAALAGVTLQQGIYRCAVSYAGISDLPAMRRFEVLRKGDNNALVRSWKTAIQGDAKGEPSLDQISPARFAASASAPILLLHGKDDTVVPIDQSREMASALKAAGKPASLVEFTSQDHWLTDEDSRIQILKASLDFVQANNPAN